jgi:hypothetical protein
MSMMGGRIPQGREEVGQTVADFPTYEGAQKAVSALIAGDVPARDIAIVGQGLRSIERVTGRLGYGAAARSGAINGVLLGLLFSAIFVLGTPAAPIQAFVGVMFIGIAVGMLLSIITFSIVRRRRDFASVMQVVADHYEVTVGDTSIHRARQILGREGASHSAPHAAPPVAAPVPPRPAAPAPPDAAPPAAVEPPRYGERIPPVGAAEPRTPVAPAAPAPAAPAAPAPAAPTAPAEDPDGAESSGPAHSDASAESAGVSEPAGPAASAEPSAPADEQRPA